MRMLTFFGFLNMNAHVHAVTNHAVRLWRCVGFVTHNLVVLLEISGAFGGHRRGLPCSQQWHSRN